jgi:hypothetical protein
MKPEKPTQDEIKMVEFFRGLSQQRGNSFSAIQFEDGTWELCLTQPAPSGRSDLGDWIVRRGRGSTCVEALCSLRSNAGDWSWIFKEDAA